MTLHYCYDDAAKKRIAAKLKTALRKAAKAMGLSSGEYDLRFNPGGIAVWGEVTLHSDQYYIQASAGTDMGVLARRCKGRKDYTGGMNHWFPFHVLIHQPEEFTRMVLAIKE